MNRLHLLRLVIVWIGIGASASAEPNSTITVEGVTYSNVVFGSVTPLKVKIRHSSGVAQLPLESLPPELQQRFGYDPKKAAEERLREQAESERQLIAEATRKLEKANSLNEQADEANKRGAFSEGLKLNQDAISYLMPAWEFFAKRNDAASQSNAETCDRLIAVIKSTVKDLQKRIEDGSLVEVNGELLTREQYNDYESKQQQARIEMLKQRLAEIPKEMQRLYRAAHTGYSESVGGVEHSMNVSRDYDQLMQRYQELDAERGKIQQQLASAGDETSRSIVKERSRRMDARYVADEYVKSLKAQGIVRSSQFIQAQGFAGGAFCIYAMEYVTESGLIRQANYVIQLRQANTGEWEYFRSYPAGSSPY